MSYIKVAVGLAALAAATLAAYKTRKEIKVMLEPVFDLAAAEKAADQSAPIEEPEVSKAFNNAWAVAKMTEIDSCWGLIDGEFTGCPLDVGIYGALSDDMRKLIIDHSDTRTHVYVQSPSDRWMILVTTYGDHAQEERVVTLDELVALRASIDQMNKVV